MNCGCGLDSFFFFIVFGGVECLRDGVTLFWGVREVSGFQGPIS